MYQKKKFLYKNKRKKLLRICTWKTELGYNKENSKKMQIHMLNITTLKDHVYRVYAVDKKQEDYVN